MDVIPECFALKGTVTNVASLKQKTISEDSARKLQKEIRKITFPNIKHTGHQEEVH